MLPSLVSIGDRTDVSNHKDLEFLKCFWHASGIGGKNGPTCSQIPTGEGCGLGSDGWSGTILTANVELLPGLDADLRCDRTATVAVEHSGYNALAERER